MAVTIRHGVNSISSDTVAGKTVAARQRFGPGVAGTFTPRRAKRL